MADESEQDRATAVAPTRGGGSWAWPFGVGVVAAVVIGSLGLGLLLGRLTAPERGKPVTVVNAGPPVVVAIRDLARLESVQFHMERVIDLRSKQEALFGLVESEDAILLVASADVTAGVDLAKLKDGDVVVDKEASRVTITLPPAEVFSATLDNDRTYVYRRETDVLAERQETLETEARQQAEKRLGEAAKKAGILAHAEKNAAKTVERLVRSLGYKDVTVRSAR